MNKINIITTELGLKEWQVTNSVDLLFTQGATIPFVSRYRKEATGTLDEVKLQEIYLRYQKLEELEKRKETIINSIEEQGAMTDELRAKITECFDLQKLEDIYLPYKPKRRTRATIAKEKGLEPLAAMMMIKNNDEIERMATRFVKGDVESIQDAIKGAQDIVAEWISENERIRDIVRGEYSRYGTVTSTVVKKKEAEGVKYTNYFKFTEPVKRISANRYLAIDRGENEGFLKANITVEDDKLLERLISFYDKHNSCSTYKKEAIKDSYNRLISPSIITEVRNLLKERSDEEAIKIFAANLRQLLLASPLSGKRVLAIDPGFRTGCKVVCLDGNAELIINDTIYPHPPQNQYKEAFATLKHLISTYDIEAMAIGDGTAGRETESLAREVARGTKIEVYSVSEDGASVYSASTVAREEFPNHDVTVRGAISIGRRLIDPMAELVKIDPKSIGVGEYQHDVNQTKLKNTLDMVVESCVSSVGVNLNTASHHVLTYVSGIGRSVAKNITEYRAKNGDFKSRAELLKVPRLGAKVYEQAAGFLRIVGGVNPLDNSAVHPERYALIEKMAKQVGVSTHELIGNKELISKIDLPKYTDKEVGMETLGDITNELLKPSLDPRGAASEFTFADDIRTINDLTEGRELEGIVTNITSFGAFVDIGVKQDGLVHVSNMSNKFVSSPLDIVKLHQKVMVRVLEIDHARGRIALTMKF